MDTKVFNIAFYCIIFFIIFSKNFTLLLHFIMLKKLISIQYESWTFALKWTFYETKRNASPSYTTFVSRNESPESFVWYKTFQTCETKVSCLLLTKHGTLISYHLKTFVTYKRCETFVSQYKSFLGVTFISFCIVTFCIPYETLRIQNPWIIFVFVSVFYQIPCVFPKPRINYFKTN